MQTRLKMFAIAATLAAGTSSAAMAQYAACPAGYALYNGVCQPVAAAPGYPSGPVAGAAVLTAGLAASGESAPGASAGAGDGRVVSSAGGSDGESPVALLTTLLSRTTPAALVRRNGKVVGIVTRYDLLHQLAGIR